MRTKEFNALSLDERKKAVFGNGKLVAIYEDNKFQKVFYYRINDIKVDVIYDKINNVLLDVIAWETDSDRVGFLKTPVGNLDYAKRT
jgi:hypothetical protein